MIRVVRARALPLVLVALACGAAACGGTTTSESTRTPFVPTVTVRATGTATTAPTDVPPTPGPPSPTLAPSATPVPSPKPDRACHAPYPSGPATTATVFCADPAGMEAARVIRVVDGDTIHVDLNGTDETIRFYGIDTTEVGQPCFEEGKDRTRELVGSEVRLRPDARNRDRYGRLLRYVYRPDGLSIDAEMVDEGLAHAWRSDGTLRLPVIGLEDAAHAAHRGCLWR